MCYMCQCSGGSFHAAPVLYQLYSTLVHSRLWASEMCRAPLKVAELCCLSKADLKGVIQKRKILLQFLIAVMELVSRQLQWHVLDIESALQLHTPQKQTVGAGSSKGNASSPAECLGSGQPRFWGQPLLTPRFEGKHWTRSLVQALIQHCRFSPESPCCWSWCTAITDLWHLGSLPSDNNNDDDDDGREAWKILFFPWRFQSPPLIAIMLRKFF